MLHRSQTSEQTAKAKVIELVFGRWRSQILYCAVNLGVFDTLTQADEQSAKEVAQRLNVDAALLYRLLRAIASLDLAIETRAGRFYLNEAGALLAAQHPNSLRDMVLLEEGPEHYQIWRDLSGMIASGEQNGFLREYGQMAFDYARDHAGYDETFRRAMSSFSGIQTALALEALQHYDFSIYGHLCDVAGGQGHLLCSFLAAYPHLFGVVFDQPHVVQDQSGLWAEKLNVADRCDYIGGDMFEEVPPADIYLLKMILHDWSDAECVSILKNLRRQAAPHGRVFIVEHIVPGPGEAHFSKLFDIHMMCWGSGKERTQDEYIALLAAAGWTFVATHYPADPVIGVIEAAAS